jgi:predicted TIM-barrel fold metal-dependent hydrolase
VIVDAHTHVFPPQIIANRDAFLASDPTFAEMYGSSRAKLATADDLIESMDAAGVDVSVTLGFAWRDPAVCRLHNDYLLEAAAASSGRLISFCALPLGAGARAVTEEMTHCVAAGARGFGELRPESQGGDLSSDVGDALAELALAHGSILLFHVSEPVGHTYAGKRGLRLEAFYEFVLSHPGVKTIGAHWGGGLPFYALMPEVKLALADTWLDTAGSSLLYQPHIYEKGAGLVGAGKVLFGSDFPLLSQVRSRSRIEESGLDAEAQALILGENACRLFRLE